MYFTSRRAAKYQPDNPERLRLRRYAPDTDNAFFNTTNIVAAMRLNAIILNVTKLRPCWPPDQQVFAEQFFIYYLFPLLLVRRPTTATG